MNMKNNSKYSNQERFQEQIKSFAKYIKLEMASRDKRSHSIRNSLKEREFENSNLKQKIIEYIKTHFKEKFPKNEVKTFFSHLAREFYDLIRQILKETKINLEKSESIESKENCILNYIRQFYQEIDLLHVGRRELMEEILKEEADGSYLMSILSILNYSKVCDALEYLLEKDKEISDIGTKTIMIMCDFQKVLEFVNSSENFNNSNFISFVNTTVNSLIPYFIRFFNELIQEIEMKTIFLMLNYDDFMMVCRSLSYFPAIRKILYNVFIRMHTCIKDGYKIRSFKNYIMEKKCIEGVLASIVRSAENNSFQDFNYDIFKELITILLISNVFYEKQVEIKDEIFRFLTNVFEEYVMDLKEFDVFAEKCKYLINELIYLSYFDKFEIKNKIWDKSLLSFENTKQLITNTQEYRDFDVINFLLNLFAISDDFYIKFVEKNMTSNNLDKINGCDEGNLRGQILESEFPKITSPILEKTNPFTTVHSASLVQEKIDYLKKIILQTILDSEMNLKKYNLLISDTNYCSKILKNLHKLPSEVISIPFDTILILLSENYSISIGNSVNSSNTSIKSSSSMSYWPEKELTEIIQCLADCNNEDFLNLILTKYFKIFLNFSGEFYVLFKNCKFFEKVLDIFDKTLSILEDQSNSVSGINVKSTRGNLRPLSRDVLLNLLNVAEQILNNLNLSREILKIMINDKYFTYFEKFIKHPEYKQIAYKIWSLSMLHKQDDSVIREYVEKLKSRYITLKNNLENSQFISVRNLKIIFEEIYRINEIICENFSNENMNRISDESIYIPMKEILSDYLEMLMKIERLNINNLPRDNICDKDKESTEGNILSENLKISNYPTQLEITSISQDESSNKIKIFWDTDMQKMLKGFFRNLIKMILECNRNIFNAKFKQGNLKASSSSFDKNEKLDKNSKIYNLSTGCSCGVNEKELKILIRKSLILLEKISSSRHDKVFLQDFLKFLIDSSLRFKLNEKNESLQKHCYKDVLDNDKEDKLDTLKHIFTDDLFSYNLVSYYKEIHNVRETYLNNCYESYSNYSNFILQSPMIIILVLNSLRKAKNCPEIKKEFLEFVDFLCKVSENNTKLLMKQGLVKELLKYLTCEDSEIGELPVNHINTRTDDSYLSEKIISKNANINDNMKEKSEEKIYQDENTINIMEDKDEFQENPQIENLIISDENLNSNASTSKNKCDDKEIEKNMSHRSEISEIIINIFEIITSFMSQSEIELLLGHILMGVEKYNKGSLNQPGNISVSEKEKESKEKNNLKMPNFSNNSSINSAKGDNSLLPNTGNNLFLFNIKIINRLLTIIKKKLIFSRKINKSVILSPIITRQPNVYNMLFTGNLKFANQSALKEYFTNDYTSSTSKSKSSTISVILQMRFHNSMDNSKFVLFKFEKENNKEKEKDAYSFEVCIQDKILFLKENDKEIFSCDDLTKFISIDQSICFLFIFEKEMKKDSVSIEIQINEKLLTSKVLDMKFLEINSTSSYSLVTGYSSSSAMELYGDHFSVFPHVSLSYLAIYTDKILKEHFTSLKLAQVMSSKNGSIKSQKFSLKYLNKKSYKMYQGSHYIYENKDLLKYITLKNFDENKVVYEFLPAKIDLISKKQLMKAKSDLNICNNFLYKIQKKYNIELLDKDFVAYVGNTNYMNVENFISPSSTSNNSPSNNFNSIYNNTYLISKIDYTQCILLNQIYDLKFVKSQILQNVIGIHNNMILSTNLQSLSFVEYIFIILNEIGDYPALSNSSEQFMEDETSVLDSKIDYFDKNFSLKKSKLLVNEKEPDHFNLQTSIPSNLSNSNILSLSSTTMHNILKILSIYLISNIYEINSFLEGDKLKSLLIILYKNHKLLTNDILDIFFNLSFGKEDLKEISVFNPWFPQFITEIILDFQLFKLLNLEQKAFIIRRLKGFLNRENYITIVYEGIIDTKVTILTKLYKIIMLIESDINVDEDILNVINTILEQTLKTRPGEFEPTSTQLSRIMKKTQEFIFICEYFNDSITCHVESLDFDAEQLNTTQYLVKSLYRKLFTDEIKEIKKNFLNYFSIIRASTSGNQNTGTYNTFNSSPFEKFFIDLYQKEISKSGTSTKRDSTLNQGKNKNIKKQNDSGKIQTTNSNDDDLFNSEKKRTLTSVRKIIIPKLENKNFCKSVTPRENYQSAYNNQQDWFFVDEIKNNDQRFASMRIGEEYIVDDNNNNLYTINQESQEKLFDCKGDECLLCIFLQDVLKNSFTLVSNFYKYKNFVKNFFLNLNHKMDLKSIVHPGKNKYNYLNNKGVKISWKVFNHEGPARMKNKLITKIDYIRNEELSKRYYEDVEKIAAEENFHKYSDFDRLFSFINVKHFLNDSLHPGQIFNLSTAKILIDSDDLFEASYNCLLIRECYHLDCVLILGRKNFYLFQNFHVDKNNNLIYAKEKFKRYFWTVNDYDQEWENGCPYLNNFSLGNVKSSENLVEDIRTSQNESKETHPIKDERTLRKITNRIKMYKFSRVRKETKVLSFAYADINELHKRRFLLKNNSIEFFIKKGKNFLLSFNLDKRDIIFGSLVRKISEANQKNSFYTSNSLLQANSSILTKSNKIVLSKTKGKLEKTDRALIDGNKLLEDCSYSWSQGHISNYNYMMLVNTIAGRSFSDLSQYHIMPWIIKDYNSEGLNLHTEETYRDLQYPIHALEDNTRKNLRHKYEDSEESFKFHSGSHYSSPGFICYYLIRLKPFSYISAEIQGGYFDIADRLFHNIKTIWDISDKYQELIPEMFYLPELFVNYNNFHFGYNQNHSLVNDVVLPAWAKGDPRLFCKMSKKALESSKVSTKISDWIDLIFGFKQQGNESVNFCNTFRKLCYEGKIDANILNEQEREDKMTEIHDFGQIPVMVFNKMHVKKERHEKSISFLSRPNYLDNLYPKEKSFSIILDTKPSEMKGLFECDMLLSKGEGGLSSFQIYKPENDDKPTKTLDATTTFSIVGKKKILLGPKFVSFIDFSLNKYSFSIVDPLNKMCFEFHTSREAGITDIKASRNGKKIIISYYDGVISLYNLKKLLTKEKSKLIHPDNMKKKEKGFFKIFTKSPSYNSNASFSKKDSITQSDLDKYNTAYSKSNSLLDSNNLTDKNLSNDKEVIIPVIKYYNLNDEWRDHFIHYNQNGINLNNNKNKGINDCQLILLNKIKTIPYPIKFMELSEPFSCLIIVDKLNNVYLFDFNKFKLVKELNFNLLLKNFGMGNIKFIKICELTGDFVIVSSSAVLMFNINGVILGSLNLQEYPILDKITCVTVKSLKRTESDLHLITGHKCGTIIIWRVQYNTLINIKEEFSRIYMSVNSKSKLPMDIKDNDKDYLDSYRFNYDKEFFHANHKRKDLKLKLIFYQYKIIQCKKDIAIRLIKLNEDASILIVINDDSTLSYFNYTEAINRQSKEKSSIKFCPQCNGHLGNSKINCSLCEMKLCSQCKTDITVPEITFKSVRPVCDICLSIICSKNKMLYDY